MNRLTAVNAFISPEPAAYPLNYNYTFAMSNGDYDNTFSYDANGNIITQLRNGITSIAQGMDDLHYRYYLDDNVTEYDPQNGTPLNATNRLAQVIDNPFYNANYTDDIDKQNPNNYTYDNTGNLISDLQEEIANIEWTVYGKVKKVTRTLLSHKPDLEFAYDASGSRIMKLVKPRTTGAPSNENEWAYTFYVRDAQGNILAVYDKKYLPLGGQNFQEALSLDENNIYGSSRLGTYSRANNTIALNSFTSLGFNPVTHLFKKTNVVPLNIIVPTNNYSRILGEKTYEMANYLGSVATTVSDRKLPVDANSDNILDFYLPDLVSATDYFAGGFGMPGRNFNSNSYRYGNNSQEKVDEWAPWHYTAEFWEYDSRTLIRQNPDPIVKVWESPYATFSNNPILNSDPEGNTDDPANGTPPPSGNSNSSLNFKNEIKSKSKWSVTINAIPGTNIDFSGNNGSSSTTGPIQLNGQNTAAQSNFKTYDSRGNYFPPSDGPFTDHANHYLGTFQKGNILFTAGIIHDKWGSQETSIPGQTFRYKGGGREFTALGGLQKNIEIAPHQNLLFQGSIGGYASRNEIGVDLMDHNTGNTFTSNTNGRQWSGGGGIAIITVSYDYVISKHVSVGLSVNGIFMAGVASANVSIKDQSGQTSNGRLSVNYGSASTGFGANVTLHR